jgi:hypothetical protein
MRFIKTFILHLYFDTDSPDHLCGNLQLLPDRNLTAFRNKTEMLGLLERSAAAEIEASRQTEIAQSRSENESHPQ